jgi:O-methyltransferase involved in polyketide biosynthesis
MPRLHVTEFDAPPDQLTDDLRARLEAAGFDLSRPVQWLRDGKRGVVYFQDEEKAA